MERDPFKEIPDTRQGIGLYQGYALKEIKRMERKIKVLQNNLEECSRRLGAKEPSNG